ncbi:hypothetical protein C7974DRAFT_217167 [Boeremia exigua]|uniref:uncharacterized protein n=1 Tax=Boeremia exigua TaxID=749465 RepID=UPI001E8DF30D|nr:uncharacterized protein C7974DRAFT_217167 [Boeremia exigua]KAH6622156.1 hypothetical protein C7974DRAFT_217167 [Boeremia exigua]
MFAFHKNETLSRSRQSSIDSPLSESASLTSVPDSMTASQYSDSFDMEGMHSPERRRKAASGRRSSVFNMRSRSNTAASTASSISPSHTDMTVHDHASPSSPPSLRQVPSQSRLDNAGPRRSMFRGKMGKRLSESIGSGLDIDDFPEADPGKKRASFLRKRKGTNESESSHHELKNRISSPFDFQHLTHAGRHQIAALEQNPESVMAAGWAQHAAQASTSASQGAHRPRQRSTDNLMASKSAWRSPPQSPRQSGWQQPEFQNGASLSRPELRLTRSVESFSQPGMNLRAHRHSSSVVAPPRTTSLLPASSITNIPEEMSTNQASTTSPSFRSKRQSGIWDAFTLSAVPQADQLPGIGEDSSFVGNAVTTPDDSAIQAMTPPFSPSLEDVAEEPERFVSPRPAPQPPRLKTPTSPKPFFSEPFSFNHQRSSGVRTRPRGNSRASPKSASLNVSNVRPVSHVSETFASPSSTRESPVPRPTTTRRKSNTWRAIEESWEEDVDYIYEHALEAECDNDWDCVSEDEDFTDRHRALTRAIYEERPSIPETLQSSQYSASSKPMFQLQMPFPVSRLPPSNDSVPELGTASTVSASTTGTALQTPFHEAEGFALSPSLLLPQDYKEVAETSYEDILKEYDGSDCHFPLMDPDESATSSTRSSRVRFSRRSSYDSSLVSSAQSSGLWRSPVRRSASSAGSVPELVHSRRTRQHFSLVVDELSEQVAAMQAFGSDGEEDDDVTPPGPSRLSTERSFFTSAQELSDNQSYQRNTHSHKQALSDGAAHLPVSAEHVKPRARAATTSRTNEQEYLHLFPTPPSFSPPISN